MSNTNPDIKNRLSKIEGQVKGIQKMVEEERYCVDILTQIYDDIGKFVIEVDSGYVKQNWGVDLWII